MTGKTTRRAVLTGAAAVPVLSLPVSAVETDPIFAAIERHKVAYQRQMEASRVRFHTVDAEWSPDFDAKVLAGAESSEDRASEVYRAASLALIDIKPTTIKGIVALIEYVEQFNNGAFALAHDSSNWHSAPEFWPPMPSHDGEMDMFGFAVLSHVRRALEAFGGAS